MDDLKLKRFSELAARRRELESELNAVRAEMAELEAYLLEAFEKAGISNVSVDGMTCYLHRQLWARAKEGNYERACMALREVGLGRLVEQRFNTNSLSAWVREHEAEGKALPSALADAIEVSEVFSVRTRKGG